MQNGPHGSGLAVAELVLQDVVDSVKGPLKGIQAGNESLKRMPADSLRKKVCSCLAAACWKLDENLRDTTEEPGYRERPRAQTEKTHTKGCFLQNARNGIRAADRRERCFRRGDD